MVFSHICVHCVKRAHIYHVLSTIEIFSWNIPHIILILCYTSPVTCEKYRHSAYYYAHRYWLIIVLNLTRMVKLSAVTAASADG